MSEAATAGIATGAVAEAAAAAATAAVECGQVVGEALSPRSDFGWPMIAAPPIGRGCEKI